MTARPHQLSLRVRAIAALDRALVAVANRNVSALRIAQHELSDLLSGHQLVLIAKDYEREHGLEPAPELVEVAS